MARHQAGRRASELEVTTGQRRDRRTGRGGVTGATRSTLAALLGAALLLGGVACEPADEEAPTRREAQRRDEIQQALTSYLPDLAHAYSTGEVEVLRPWAVDRLVAQTQRRIAELGEQGLMLQATFHELTVEEVVTWDAFSLVTTLEVWDLRYLSLGTRVSVSERPGARSRVQYQIRREEGRWRVFHRELVQDLDADA